MTKHSLKQDSFDRTKKAASLFSNLISCAQPDCTKENSELLHLGTACKHAFCWDCVNKLQTISQPMCSRCFSPLEVAKPITAVMFNNLAASIQQFGDLLSDYERAVERDGICVQKNFQTQKLFEENFESPPRRTVDEFMATQIIKKENHNSSRRSLKSPSPIQRSRTGSAASELSFSPELDELIKVPPKPEKSSAPPYSTQNPGFFMSQYVSDSNVEEETNSDDCPPVPIVSKSYEFTKVPRTTYGRKSKEKCNTKWDQVLQDLPADDSFDEIVKNALSTKNTPRSTVNSIFCTPPSNPPSKPCSRRPSISRNKGEYTIIKTVNSGNAENLTRLLHAGHDVNEIHPVQGTPLCVAVKMNRLDLCEILVENGAVINAHCGVECNTALHFAVETKSEDIVKYLLSKGASRTVKNLRARTAADMAESSSPLRKLVEKYRNYPRQPSIPPPLPDNFIAMLSSDVNLTETQKAALIKMITFVPIGNSTATHYVTKQDARGLVEAKSELLMAMLRGAYIVTVDWLYDCLNRGELISDSLRYEVQRLGLLDSGLYEGGVQLCRRSKDKMEPGLFRGCKFYLPHPKFPPYGAKQVISELIRLAEGEVLTREPTKNGEDPFPFHGRKLCNSPYFVVCDPNHSVPDRILKKTFYHIVSAGWIFECLTKYEFVKPF